MQYARWCGQPGQLSIAALTKQFQSRQRAYYLDMKRQYELHVDRYASSVSSRVVDDSAQSVKELLMGDFPGEDEFTRSYGLHGRMLWEIYMDDFAEREPLLKGAMAALHGRAIKLDYTWIPQIKNGAAMPAHLALMNEVGQIIKFVMVQSEKAEYLEEMFKEVAKRFDNANVERPRMLSVDRDCCTPGRLLFHFCGCA